jgi:hypothetical protein
MGQSYWDVECTKGIIVCWEEKTLHKTGCDICENIEGSEYNYTVYGTCNYQECFD